MQIRNVDQEIALHFAVFVLQVEFVQMNIETHRLQNMISHKLVQLGLAHNLMQKQNNQVLQSVKIGNRQLLIMSMIKVFNLEQIQLYVIVELLL